MLSRIAQRAARPAVALRLGSAACAPRAARQNPRFFSDDAVEDPETLKAKIHEMREQIKELKEKKAGCKHDAQQAQKRHVTDLDNETKYAITKFAKELLKVADNLERASSSLKSEEIEADAQLKRVHSAVARLQEVVSDALKEFGIIKMEPMDDTFDPERHEAMFAMPMPGKEPNVVFHVMETGYMIHDRTLRAAKVGVTRA